MFKLVIQDDEGKTTVVPLIRDEITIGRKEGNTIRLTERNVSRRHARILRQNGEVQIEDLGSYNGIRVNNARIAERVALRVSDQVQIGDYKLYLKAEGVEQVDDARTMPIERVDAPTDMMAAVTAPGTGNGTPTMPLGVPATPAPAGAQAGGLAGAQLVGNPNRTLVAIADTDPAGRPVATAATVAALTAPVGYGKLVVLSSNFAGKEFELSRPQMIIGRTDENDIVINHRSISRNHAKLVREPDSGRYTISDLQSSNGVRVNGQDYGKVELRRGDVVDLGHVRLRFVEAGEDFLFSRDAVITDVPDVGGKKTLLVAIVLGIVVLGGVGVFFLMQGGKKPVVVEQGSGTNGTNDVGVGPDGSQVAVVEPGSGAEIQTPPPVIDAGEATTNNPTTTADDVKVECLKLAADKKWDKLLECSDRLATSDSAKAKELRATAGNEKRSAAAMTALETALTAKNYKAARTELDKIPQESVYRADAKKRFDDVTEPVAQDYLDRARSAAADKNCRLVDKIQRDASSKGLGDRVSGVKCEAATVAVKNPNTGSGGSNPDNGTNTVKTPPPNDCDAAALKAKGDDHLQTGMDAAALAAFEASMKCKPDGSIVRLAFMAACRSRNAPKAKLYYGKMPQNEATARIAQICIRNQIDPTK